MLVSNCVGTYSDYLYRSTTLSIVFKFTLVLTQLAQLYIINCICKKNSGSSVEVSFIVTEPENVSESVQINQQPLQP